jgi:hypothetical protein
LNLENRDYQEDVENNKMRNFIICTSLQELQNRIVTALGGAKTDMLHRVWQETDYRLDVCRVTRGAHTVGLWRAGMKLGKFFYVLK